MVIVWPRVRVIPGKQTLRHAQMFRDLQGERTGGEEVRSQGTTAQWRRGCRNRETLASPGGGDTSCERLLGTKGGPEEPWTSVWRVLRREGESEERR